MQIAAIANSRKSLSLSETEPASETNQAEQNKFSKILVDKTQRQNQVESVSGTSATPVAIYVNAAPSTDANLANLNADTGNPTDGWSIDSWPQALQFDPVYGEEAWAQGLGNGAYKQYNGQWYDLFTLTEGQVRAMWPETAAGGTGTAQMATGSFPSLNTGDYRESWKIDSWPQAFRFDPISSAEAARLGLGSGAYKLYEGQYVDLFTLTEGEARAMWPDYANIAYPEAESSSATASASSSGGSSGVSGSSASSADYTAAAASTSAAATAASTRTPDARDSTPIATEAQAARFHPNFLMGAEQALKESNGQLIDLYTLTEGQARDTWPEYADIPYVEG